MHPGKNRVNEHHNFPQPFMLTGNHYCIHNSSSKWTQIHFFKVISPYMTVQVMWKVPAWGLTF